MSGHSSLFESITDEKNESRNIPSTAAALTLQYDANKTKSNFQFRRGFSEILFDLFPSVFMPYLDVETYLNLLRTDVWDWDHLLSDRIVHDYCNYISIRHREQIEKFCQECTETDLDSTDTDSEFYLDIENNQYCYDRNINLNFRLKDEEQNFAIISSPKTIDIDATFVSSAFYDIDIINDRMSLITDTEIGLSSNLCKNITNIHYFKLKGRHSVFVYDTFTELQNYLERQQYYNRADFEHIASVLLPEILHICVDKWYFVEWNEIRDDQFMDSNQCLTQVIESKQMIIGHFSAKCTKYTQKELFVTWCIEWQSTQIMH